MPRPQSAGPRPTEVTIVHNAYGDYKMRCNVCGKLLGGWIGAVPAKQVFVAMDRHLNGGQGLPAQCTAS